MCRQFTLTAEDWSDILETYGLLDTTYQEFTYGPRYNIKTSESVVAVLSDGDTRRIGTMKWGLIPAWAKEQKIGSQMVNARAETLLEKPSFRGLVGRKRCLILADGYYEYQHVGKEKLPYRFVLRDRQVFGFAGLWDTWTSPAGDKIHSCTIITSEPNAMAAPIHDRQPVILSREAEDIWLDPFVRDSVLLTSLLRPYPAENMRCYRVSKVIGQRGFDGPECIQEVIA